MTWSSSVDAVELLLDAVSSRPKARVVDIGCGGGGLAKRLTDVGATVFAVDPNEGALAMARRAAPNAEFYCAKAQSLPFDDGYFDFAVFLNSLHHVEAGAMDAALLEAARVVGDHGLIFVIEPCAAGALFDVLKLIDDETVVRGQAQDAVERSVSSGVMRLERRICYARLDSFKDVDQFIDRITAVEPARRDAAQRRRVELSELFDEHSRPGAGDGRTLIQPMVASLLIKGGKTAKDGAP